MTDTIAQSPEKILEMLTRSLASKPLPQDRLSKIARALSTSKAPVIGVDVCTIGMCIDRRWQGALADVDLSSIIDDALGDIRGIEIFPEGIISPDGVRLRVTHSL